MSHEIHSLPPPAPEQTLISGVPKARLMMAALGFAAIASVGLELWREGEWEAAQEAYVQRDWFALVDIITHGELGDIDDVLKRSLVGREIREHLPQQWRAYLEDFLVMGQDAVVAEEVGEGGVDPSALQRPSPVDSHLKDPKHQMHRFYSTLMELGEKTRDKARILFFGTSEIGHDMVTSQMRRRLQERFGDGGKGWVLINRTWKILDHRDVLWNYGYHDWTGYSIRTGEREDGLYGLGGVLHINNEPTTVEYRTVGEDYSVAEGFYPFVSGRTWSSIELHYQRVPDGGPFEVSVDERPFKTIETGAETVMDATYRTELKDGPHRFRVRVGKQPTHLYGVILERPRGLVLDALMVIGAWGDSILNFNPDQLKRLVAQRDPALLIFQYGAKEVLRSPELTSRQVGKFATGFAKSIARVRAAKPSAACLVISAKDQARFHGGRIETSPGVPKIVEAARQVARQQGCAFYDLYQAMGGSGTVRRWLQETPRLVMGDYKHLSPRGAIRVGDILSDMLLKEFDAFAAWHKELTVGDNGSLSKADRMEESP